MMKWIMITSPGFTGTRNVSHPVAPPPEEVCRAPLWSVQ
jgi:hypothetical protein